MGKISGEFAPNSPRSDAPRPAPAPMPPQTPQQPAPGPLGGQDAGGSFRLDTDQVRALLGEWKSLRADLQGAVQVAEPITLVHGPGTDPASDGLSTLAKRSGAAYVKHVGEMLRYVDDYVKKMEKAVQGHTANDQDHAADLNRKHA